LYENKSAVEEIARQTICSREELRHVGVVWEKRHTVKEKIEKMGLLFRMKEERFSGVISKKGGRLNI